MGCLAVQGYAQADMTVAGGEPFTIANVSPATPGAIYRWLEDGRVIPSATSESYSTAKNTAGVYAYVRQAKTEDCGAWMSSNQYTVAVICEANRTSAPATDNQTVSQDLPVADITYAIDGVFDAVENLPTGVTYTSANNTLTISGRPTASGTFVYSVKMCGVVVVASGTITVLPPDTWVFGSQSYSIALRYPVAGCTSTATLSFDNPPPAQYKDNGDSYGYYYNWSCVSYTANALCPEPWHVPTQAEFSNLVLHVNQNFSTLIEAWGLPGYAWRDQVESERLACYLWSASPTDELAASYLYVSNSEMYENAYVYAFGFNVRCVR
jgi:hypothetical protein